MKLMDLGKANTPQGASLMFRDDTPIYSPDGKCWVAPNAQRTVLGLYSDADLQCPLATTGDTSVMKEIVEQALRGWKQLTPADEAVLRCLQFSYLVELLSDSEDFWRAENPTFLEEFLDETFGCTPGATMEDVLNVVTPVAASERHALEAAHESCYILLEDGTKAGALRFYNDRIVFLYELDGIRCSEQIRIPKFEEAGNYTERNWLLLCHDRLFQQLLASCGVYSDAKSFFYAPGLTETSPYGWVERISLGEVKTPRELHDRLFQNYVEGGS